MDNLNELLSSPCVEALSALHSANFMPRRLRQPDRIDNLSTDSFNPHCPSSLPPSLAAHSFVLPQSATQPRPMPREKGRGNNAR